MSRVLALDHGTARCGVAISDPTGELVTPLATVERPDTRRGLEALVALAEERGAERVVVGLPLTLSGDEGIQARAVHRFAQRLAKALPIPVDLWDERLTTRQAEREGGSAPPDSRAAALLLENWLAAHENAEARS